MAAQSNPFKGYADRVREIVAGHLQTIAAEVVDDMQVNLERKPNIVTGALYNSCSYRMERDGDKITAYIYADAKSADGEMYAEFIEFGTGVFAEGGGGRTVPWRYQDAEGNWHMTSGSRPYPFIRPAWAAHEGDFLKLSDNLTIEHAMHRFRRKL